MKKLLLKSRAIVLLDDEDYEKLKNLSWQLNSSGYARRTICCKKNKCGYKTLLMHRFIMKIEDPQIKIDHINGNKLDNRKENLRICTQSQNQQNRKVKKGLKFKGIYFDKRWHYRHRPWCAEIRIMGKKKFLGYFATDKEAGDAYKHAAKLLHGEFYKEC